MAASIVELESELKTLIPLSLSLTLSKLAVYVREGNRKLNVRREKKMN